MSRPEVRERYREGSASRSGSPAWPAVFGFAGLFSFLAGTILYGAPKGPDIPQGIPVVLGSFLIFLSVLFAQLSWGHLIGLFRGRTLRLWEKYLWGSTLTSVLLATLGYLPGSVGAGAALAWRFFLLLGCGTVMFLTRREWRSKALNAGDWADLPAILAFTLAGIGAGIPRSFWDSLWYELTAGRLWFQAGHVFLPPRLPIAFQTGLWDYQLLLGQLLLGSPGGGGLIAAQLFGQFTACFCAFFAFLALHESKDELGLSPFAAFAGIVGTELFFEAEFAKNDWAVVLWSLAALIYLRERRFRAAALTAGLAFATKISAAFFLAPLLAWLAWELRREPLRLLRRAGWFALGALPLLARNLVFTGNPFFPALTSLFPSPLQGPSWAGVGAYATMFTGPAGWLAKLPWLARSSTTVLGLAAWPFTRRKLPARAREPLAVSLAALAILFFGMGPHTEWRFAGAGLVLGAAYGARAVELLLARFGAWGLRALFVAGLLWFPIDWKAPVDFLRGPGPALRIRSWVSGGAMAWVRMNADPGSAATLNETRIYYLFPGEPRRAFDDPDLDRRLAAARGPEDLPVIFRGAGIRYLVLSAEFVDKAYDRRVCDWAYELSEKHPEAVVYRETLSRVLDLGRLVRGKQR